MNHSPAPWRVERNGHNHWGKVEVVGPRMSVVGFTVATDVAPHQALQTVADAELIASAPDLSRKLKAWKEMAANLYSWEPIEALAADGREWSGARRMLPPGFTEVSNRAGVSPEEWQEFCETNT